MKPWLRHLPIACYCVLVAVVLFYVQMIRDVADLCEPGVGCFITGRMLLISSVLLVSLVAFARIIPYLRSRWGAVVLTIAVSVLLFFIFDVTFIFEAEHGFGKGPNIHDVYPEWRIID